MRPASEPAVEFAEPDWAPGIEVVSAAVTPSRRTITRDVGTGRITIATDFSYFGEQAYRNGVHYREDMRDEGTVVLGDPLSAAVRCERTIRMRQGDWSIRVEAWATMSRPQMPSSSRMASTRTRARRASPRSCGRARSRATSSDHPERIAMRTKNPNTVAAPLTAGGRSRSRAASRSPTGSTAPGRGRCSACTAARASARST